VTSDHHALTPPRRAELLRIARGEHTKIQRIRLRWFVSNGYIVLGERPAPSDARRRVVERTLTLTDKAWKELDLPPSNVPRRLVTQGVGYVSFDRIGSG
jgi:diketogulonate reductase-like aldo/keto reductase